MKSDDDVDYQELMATVEDLEDLGLSPHCIRDTGAIARELARLANRVAGLEYKLGVVSKQADATHRHIRGVPD